MSTLNEYIQVQLESIASLAQVEGMLEATSISGGVRPDTNAFFDYLEPRTTADKSVTLTQNDRMLEFLHTQPGTEMTEVENTTYARQLQDSLQALEGFKQTATEWCDEKIEIFKDLDTNSHPDSQPVFWAAYASLHAAQALVANLTEMLQNL